MRRPTVPAVLRRIALSALSAMVIALPAAAGSVNQRLDPWLRMLAAEVSQGRNPLVASSGSRMSEFVEVGSGPGGIVLAGVLVRTSDVSATKNEIAALSGTVGVAAGSIVTARVPTNTLETLAERPEVLSVEASRINRPLLNVSRVEVGAGLVNAGTSLPAGYTGRGVIVGIVDSGIDYRHPDFNTSSGSRLLGIRDVSGFSAPAYGTCDVPTINAGTCPEVDVDGHGTHVAGTAAGNGRALAGYAGMAPEAGILAAKATRSTSPGGRFTDNDVIEACQWIFSQAQALRKPAVINLSLGGQLGPHDGTTNYETSLAALEGAGRIIVVSAGNDGPSGNHLIHVGYQTSGVDFNSALETEWRFNNLPSSPGTAVEESVDIWYPSGSIYFGVAVRDSTGAVVGGWVGVGPGTSAINQLMSIAGVGTKLGYVSIDATVTSDPNNSNRHVIVKVNNGNGTIDMRGYTYSLVTWGSGTFDGWLYTAGNGSSTFTAANSGYWRPGDSGRTIGIPGTGPRIITVGAYTTKTQFVDFNGTTEFRTNCGLLSDIACFSSRGPTRDGRTKPEISAPGQTILAPFSSSSQGNHSQMEVLQGGYYLAEQGTSQAAPHVTGIVALMLQVNPNLTPEQVLTVLQQSARRDSFTGATLNTTWGAGKVDALQAVKAVGGGGGATVCTEDANTMCLIGGRYRVTSRWKNQYAGGATANLYKAKLTDTTGAFWLFDGSTYEYMIRINTATDNGRAWIAIPTFTSVEFWVTVTDTIGGQTKEYHSAPGNLTLLYDPSYFVYP